MDITTCQKGCRARSRSTFWGYLCAFLGLPTGARAQTDISQPSREQLMEIEVTSVSRKEQKLSRVATAIFVITRQDIRHSGARNVPDLLRLVPGLDVAEIDANTWAISARGFNAPMSTQGDFLPRRSETARTRLPPGRSKLDSTAQTSRPAPGECPAAAARTRAVPSWPGHTPKQFRIEDAEEGALRRRAANMDARIP